MHHDVVVIGASAGSVEILANMARDLPRDLPASVFIALHTSPKHSSSLPELLSSRGPLPATHPVDDEAIVASRIYVAPPDNHLTLKPGKVMVARGPKENGHRPAADVLFRTAAAAYGSRVIGIVLSGHQDCGTEGMLAIHARGGLVVVQEPATASAPEMPRNVLSRVHVDRIVTPETLAETLVRLVATEAVSAPTGTTSTGGADRAAELVCPLCQGVLTETMKGTFKYFHCHVGHGFSLAALVREQSDSMERALWAAVRSLEESATLSARLSSMERGELKERFAEKSRTQVQQAETIRQVLLHGSMLSTLDARELEQV
jgi:two-component system, chemotaxis family, protein-glutamate methylesterase/glutaminase